MDSSLVVSGEPLARIAIRLDSAFTARFPSTAVVLTVGDAVCTPPNLAVAGVVTLPSSAAAHERARFAGFRDDLRSTASVPRVARVTAPEVAGEWYLLHSNAGDGALRLLLGVVGADGGSSAEVGCCPRCGTTVVGCGDPLTASAAGAGAGAGARPVPGAVSDDVPPASSKKRAPSSGGPGRGDDESEAGRVGKRLRSTATAALDSWSTGTKGADQAARRVVDSPRLPASGGLGSSSDSGVQVDPAAASLHVPTIAAHGKEACLVGASSSDSGGKSEWLEADILS